MYKVAAVFVGSLALSMLGFLACVGMSVLGDYAWAERYAWVFVGVILAHVGGAAVFGLCALAVSIWRGPVDDDGR